MRRIRIEIDYSICGDGHKIDPRECALCLKQCEPAVFLMHQTLGMENDEEDPLDPQIWRVTPLYPSQCTLCMKCLQNCPENAIKIHTKEGLFSKFKPIPLSSPLIEKKKF